MKTLNASMKTFTAVVSGLVLMSASARASIVVNGGFDTGALGLEGWACSVTSGECLTAAYQASPQGGTHFAGYQNEAPEGLLRQTLATVSGATYSVSFHFNSGFGDPFNALRLSVGILEAPMTLVPSLAWSTYSGSFVASGTSTHLDFLFLTAPGAGTVNIDGVVVEMTSAGGGGGGSGGNGGTGGNGGSVPVPGTMALMLGALIGAGAVRRGRSRPTV